MPDSQTDGTSPLARKIFGQLISAGYFAPDGPQNLNTDNSVWLPKLGVRYALAPEWVAGLTAQRLPHRRCRLQLPARFAPLWPGTPRTTKLR
jgi:hypothetical protein